jgi:thiol-disulfide isomerase/thioredoxin
MNSILNGFKKIDKTSRAMSPRSRQNTRKRTHSSGRISAPVDVNSADKVQKFESLIGPVLVLVYADWCGHCQHYKPLWKQLEKDPNRSINMASVRDDMVSNTSLSQRASPVSSYPTVLLIGKNGKAVNFKNKAGAESEAIPDHGNMENMRAIVRNAGTPEGEAALLSTPSPVVTRQNVEEVPEPEPDVFSKPSGPTRSPPNIAADVVNSSKERTTQGGSLFELLSQTAYSDTMRGGSSTTTRMKRDSPVGNLALLLFLGRVVGRAKRAVVDALKHDNREQKKYHTRKTRRRRGRQ